MTFEDFWFYVYQVRTGRKIEVSARGLLKWAVILAVVSWLFGFARI